MNTGSRRGKGEKKNPRTEVRGFQKVAEKEGFEPSRPFWGLHDFQSCALDQTTRLLRVCSTFRSAVLFCVARAGQATIGIIAGFCQKSSPFLKKFKKVFPPSGKGKQRGGRGREVLLLQIEIVTADGAVIRPAAVGPGVHGGDIKIEAGLGFPHAVEAELGRHDAALVRVVVDGPVGHRRELAGGQRPRP